MTSSEDDQPMFEDIHVIQKVLSKTERQFQRACDQVVLLNGRLRACSVRYKRAKSTNTRSMRYPLRLRLAVVEGIRNMFYEYATKKAREVEAFRHQLAQVYYTELYSLNM
ncbi:hypothetical protein ACF0H5_017252 [Mactra antiquata]